MLQGQDEMVTILTNSIALAITVWLLILIASSNDRGGYS
jgi:hypothetical protein